MFEIFRKDESEGVFEEGNGSFDFSRRSLFDTKLALFHFVRSSNGKIN